MKGSPLPGFAGERALRWNVWLGNRIGFCRQQCFGSQSNTEFYSGSVSDAAGSLPGSVSQIGHGADEQRQIGGVVHNHVEERAVQQNDGAGYHTF